MERGVAVVDTKLPGWGQVLIDRIRTVTDKPVVTIINTHTHGDHVGSNEFFPRHGQHRRPRQHQDQHGRHAQLPRAEREVSAEADLRRSSDPRVGRRPHGPVLLRRRAHQRRRLHRLPSARRAADGGHVSLAGRAVSRHEQRRQRCGASRHAVEADHRCRGDRHRGARTHSGHDVGQPAGVPAIHPPTCSPRFDRPSARGRAPTRRLERSTCRPATRSTTRPASRRRSG